MKVRALVPIRFLFEVLSESVAVSEGHEGNYYDVLARFQALPVAQGLFAGPMPNRVGSRRASLGRVLTHFP